MTNDEEDTEPAPVVLGRADRSKSARKNRILAATRQLIIKSGEAGVVMRAIADTAGVSHATPYNLFGSKRGVLLELFKFEASAFGAAFEAIASDDPIERIFEFNDMTFKTYVGGDDFFKILLRSVYGSQNAQTRTDILKPRRLYLKKLIRDCDAAGLLDPSNSPELLSNSLLCIHAHVSQSWAVGMIDNEQARLEVGYGQGLLLLSMAARKAYPQIMAKLEQYRDRLEADRSKRIA